MDTFAVTGDIHELVLRFIEEGRAFALVSVLKDAGSTPRKAGTKAIVDSTGAIWGTIGGGVVEARGCELASEAIRSRRPVVFD